MPHLHLSLQSGDDMILKRMKRRHLRAQFDRFCAEVRQLRPDMVFGADIIAGFPTETEAMFENSLEHRRGVRADASSCLSVFAARRDAGGAHAAAAARGWSRSARPGCAPSGRPRIGVISRRWSAAASVCSSSGTASAARKASRSPPSTAKRLPGAIVEATVTGHDGEKLLAAPRRSHCGLSGPARWHWASSSKVFSFGTPGGDRGAGRRARRRSRRSTGMPLESAEGGTTPASPPAGAARAERPWSRPPAPRRSRLQPAPGPSR